MQSELRIAIVGAGICGLSTAIACQCAGFQATVFEAAPVLLPLGTAISLWPNALNCFASWGITKDINAIGYPMSQIAIRHPDGKPIMRFDLAGLHRKHGHMSRCVTRSALHETLRSHLPAAVVKLGSSVEAVNWTETEATLTFADGRLQTFDLVVIADGANSKLRGIVASPDRLRPAGYGAVLGLAETWATPLGWGADPEACEYYGPNGRFGVFRTGEQQTYWFYVSKSISQGTTASSADRAWVLEQLRDWPAFTRNLVSATPPNQMPQIAFHDRAPARHWGNGRVLLAGDAAHPMLPNFGQGANQAIEDAYAIGRGLKMGKTGSNLAQFYTKSRKKKAESIVKQNRQNGQIVQQEKPFGQMIRNAVLSRVPNRVIAAQLNKHFTL